MNLVEVRPEGDVAVVTLVELLATACRRARALADLPGHGAVKAQLRAPTAARLARIVDAGDDPLLARGFTAGRTARA